VPQQQRPERSKQRHAQHIQRQACLMMVLLCVWWQQWVRKKTSWETVWPQKTGRS